MNRIVDSLMPNETTHANGFPLDRQLREAIIDELFLPLIQHYMGRASRNQGTSAVKRDPIGLKAKGQAKKSGLAARKPPVAKAAKRK